MIALSSLIQMHAAKVKQPTSLHNLFTWSKKNLPATSTMSPGTKSLAFILWIPVLFCLNTLATSGSYSFKASIALSAFLSYGRIGDSEVISRQLFWQKRRHFLSKTFCTHLPNTNDGVYYQDYKDNERFYKCCGSIFSFLEQR